LPLTVIIIVVFVGLNSGPKTWVLLDFVHVVG